MQMTCPKCRGEMRQYERSGVVIDQCGECRGIFLDRGELEKLFDAEANWNRQHGGAPQQPAPSGAGYPPPPPPPPAAVLPV
ncbi:zf-TFIIB domain-containing protein, partial [Micromonospora aurantiaca]